MSRKCEICGKGTVSGHHVSHSDKRSKRTWKPNLHKIRAIVDGKVKRIKVCTACIRAGRVRKA
ncbi:50S ribosomal protein L28 [Candidatus Fermentibacteria bacterium]|nr:50S ribosomal protein L28 [Candidatus Fermentibacteria bacterium]